MSNITINEIHYDNVGGDSGEFVELKIPANTVLDNITISLYNGSSSAVYKSLGVGSGMASDSGDGFAYIAIPAPGLQNGAPDGVAVDLSGTVSDFISYEGTIEAVDAPAQGMTSADIGVSEGGATPVGESLQVINGAWVGPMSATPNQVNCFLAGTRIETGAGLIKVEELNIGDKVRIQDGKLKEIIWIGKQTIDPVHIKDARYGHPVRIMKDALGENKPHSDLYVSPGHGIYFDGLLINAGALVNDATIKIVPRREPFKYYHLELRTHELLLSEGLPTESFLAYNERRDNYDNVDQWPQQDLQVAKVLPWPMDYPRIVSTSQIPNEIYDQLWPSAVRSDLESV